MSFDRRGEEDDEPWSGGDGCVLETEGGMGEKPFFCDFVRRENQPPPDEDEAAGAEGSSWVVARSELRRSIWTGEARPEWEPEGRAVLIAAGGAERRWVWAMRAWLTDGCRGRVGQPRGDSGELMLMLMLKVMHVTRFMTSTGLT